MLNNSLPHSLRVSPTVSDMARKILWHKYARNHKTEFSNREVSYLQAHLDAYELSEVIDGVNFSRVQIDEILRQRRKRGPIEFEALGPYLIDYIESNGIITKDNLIPEDRIGLAIAAKLRKLLPSARLVSLYDDVNSSHGDGGGIAPPAHFSDESKENFKKSLLELFVSSGILDPDASEGTDYMKQQQDRVWEILRVLSLHPLDYHNIFYSAYGQPQQVAKVIWNRFHQTSQL